MAHMYNVVCVHLLADRHGFHFFVVVPQQTCLFEIACSFPYIPSIHAYAGSCDRFFLNHYVNQNHSEIPFHPLKNDIVKMTQDMSW